MKPIWYLFCIYCKLVVQNILKFIQPSSCILWAVCIGDFFYYCCHIAELFPQRNRAHFIACIAEYVVCTFKNTEPNSIDLIHMSSPLDYPYLDSKMCNFILSPICEGKFVNIYEIMIFLKKLLMAKPKGTHFIIHFFL